MNKYKREKIEKIGFDSPISRFIFEYEGKKIVFPLKKREYRTNISIFKK